MAESDARIELKVAENKLRVTATYFPAQNIGSPLTVDAVKQELSKLNVKVGIKIENIETIVSSDRPMRNIILAEAILPETGEKARIEPYFDYSGKRKPTHREDGSVDFHNLGDVASAKKGQELYRKIPPTVGTPGKDVFGKEIPGILGRDLKLVIGPGTERDPDDENLVRAANAGEILVKKGIVQISPIHIIYGDVDYSTGNVKFNGSIIIHGTVKSGFSVEAEGDIEIGGNVEDAQIIGGNDVIIKGGLSGSGEGSVTAKRDVILKFIENQSVRAERDIQIHGASYHAKLSAGGSISVEGNKSLIVGGVCEAKLSVTAKRFGSDKGAATIIRLGFDPHYAKHIRDIEEEIAQKKENLDKVEKTVVFLKRQKLDSKGKLPENKRVLLTKLESTKDSIPEEIKKLEESHARLIEEKNELDNAFATADIAVFSKVKVYIGQQFISVEDKLGPSTFKMSKGEVVRISK